MRSPGACNLSEQARIELEGLRRRQHEPGEIRVTGVEKHVAFGGNHRGGNEERHTPSRPNPLGTDSLQPLRCRVRAPVRGQLRDVERFCVAAREAS